jgi:hypothetical protein
MTVQEQFIEAVKRNMPEKINGVVPHSVDYTKGTGDAVVIAVYFLRAFDENGNPVDRPLTDLTEAWSHMAIYVTASGREMHLNAADLDALAKRRIASAAAVIPKCYPLFAKMAA